VQQKSPVDRLIWIDGELAPWERATVHVLSHSLQRGSLVFDYMSVHETPRGPAIFRLDLHVQRMLTSCELMGLPIGLDADVISRAIVETVRANPDATAVKASAYYASVEVDVVPMHPQVTVAIAAYDPQRDIIDRLPGERSAKRSPIRLWLEKKAHQRRDDIVSPQAKVSANYASSMTAKARAQREGFDEILLVDEDDHVAEGPTTNVFLVDSHGGLATPPERKVLRGVTRQSIIELAKADGIAVRESVVTPAELFEANEIFLTGTTAGVLPVESVDGRRIGESCPGPVAKTLYKHLKCVEAGEDSAFDHWLTYVDASTASAQRAMRDEG
jgi:branched-chain amino acid aminotransferase